MRASPQQQRLGPLPSSSPFPPNCNPQRCDICPGTTSEAKARVTSMAGPSAQRENYAWSSTLQIRIEGPSCFFSCDTVNQIPFPYDHVLFTMAHFDVAPVVACVV